MRSGILLLVFFLAGALVSTGSWMLQAWWRAQLEARYGRRYIRHPQRKPKDPKPEAASTGVAGGQLSIDSTGPGERRRHARPLPDTPQPQPPPSGRPAIGFARPAVPPAKPWLGAPPAVPPAPDPRD